MNQLLLNTTAGGLLAAGVISLGAKLLPAISSASKAGSGAARFIVSPTGATVEKAVADKWARGTFANVVDSIEYHFARHGAGRTLQHYTDDALRFFQQNKAQAQWGKWNPKWGASYRLKVGNRGDYYTADGRVITYWDK